MSSDENFSHVTSFHFINRELVARRGAVIWLTGLSGAGKTTIALAVRDHLRLQGQEVCVLDGDKLRKGLCSDLGFSAEDRIENIRRAGEAAKLLAETGVVVLAALISPFIKERATLRNSFKEGEFFEIYCACPIEICELRDVKGLYAKARAGDIIGFTGISSPYEPPLSPDLILRSHEETIDASLQKVLSLMLREGILAQRVVSMKASA